MDPVAKITGTSAAAGTAVAIGIPFVAPLLPYLVYNVYQLLINRTLTKHLLRAIKITQFFSRIAPYINSILDPASTATFSSVLYAYLVDAYNRWMSHSWLWLLGRACKEIAKWGGIPQELFDVVEEFTWASAEATATILNEAFGRNSTVMAYGGIMGRLVDETQ
ncbi:hypothetical protein TWF569_005508 [Orbilia oligospora]|uniref:Uncharacterized protein n=1 Tax=Orbilia oligospora TaxID=2813651 RepID=A0A7C8JF47_ORBOL|nr:hypothetical protein TWF102_011394 [Orbilia oligospora]KAF3115711.1 hypothetical protein TWF706_005821 [Orbilia oligospora]KAF3115712.1 hypothetical protein TWF706_005821 [Orbilia oligospora]KAF3141431.1 hypothetical protein TWF594_005988 [Orbilia oligospora]KAF3156522.1 hypothetical protein TWF569_005508 [Orbilia oligospora]